MSPAERYQAARADAIERAVLALVYAVSESDDDSFADHPAVAYLTLSESEKEEIDRLPGALPGVAG